MNVIDDQKLQSALTNVTDSVTRNLATQVLPVAGALIDATVSRFTSDLQAALGNALGDITAERTEAINDIHGIMDRMNGTEVVWTAQGFRLLIPGRA